MISERQSLARKGAMSALKLRRKLGLNLLDSICPFDVAETCGVEVRFIDISSIDAVYARMPKSIILLSSGRPLVRQVFNCAHELGHHVFGHGVCLEQLLSKRYLADPKEFLVECFAGLLLMPQIAVRNAFLQRGWSINRPTSEQLYAVACHFGVGYTTLVHHMRGGVGILETRFAESRLRERLPSIRKKILGEACTGNLIVVDQHWRGRPVDTQVGDLILLPPSGRKSGDCVRELKEVASGKVFEALKKGCGQLFIDETEWGTFIRVSEPQYVGRSMFRHLEEPGSGG